MKKRRPKTEGVLGQSPLPKKTSPKCVKGGVLQCQNPQIGLPGLTFYFVEGDRFQFYSGDLVGVHDLDAADLLFKN
jgi:hypothetical protein